MGSWKPLAGLILLIVVAFGLRFGLPDVMEFFWGIYNYMGTAPTENWIGVAIAFIVMFLGLWYFSKRYTTE